MHYEAFDTVIITLMKRFRQDIGRKLVICAQRHNTPQLMATEHVCLHTIYKLSATTLLKSLYFSKRMHCYTYP